MNLRNPLLVFAAFFLARELIASGGRSPRKLGEQPTLNLDRSDGAVIRPDVDPQKTPGLKALNKQKRDENLKDLIESLRAVDKLYKGEPDLSDVSPNVVRSPFGRYSRIEDEPPFKATSIVVGGVQRWQISDIRVPKLYTDASRTREIHENDVVDEIPPPPEENAGASTSESPSKSSADDSAHSASH